MVDWQTTILGGIVSQQSGQRYGTNSLATPRLRQASSAIVADLQPGNYTAIVRGVN